MSTLMTWEEIMDREEIMNRGETMNSQEYKEHIQGLNTLELMNEVERNFGVATETGFTSTRDKHAAIRRHKMALEELRRRQ